MARSMIIRMLLALYIISCFGFALAMENNSEVISRLNSKIRSLQKHMENKSVVSQLNWEEWQALRNCLLACEIRKAFVTAKLEHEYALIDDATVCSYFPEKNLQYVRFKTDLQKIYEPMVNGAKYDPDLFQHILKRLRNEAGFYEYKTFEYRIRSAHCYDVNGKKIQQLCTTLVSIPRFDGFKAKLIYERMYKGKLPVINECLEHLSEQQKHKL